MHFYRFQLRLNSVKYLGAYLIFSELDRNCSLAKPRRGVSFPERYLSALSLILAERYSHPHPVTSFRSSLLPIFPALLLLVLSGTDFLVGMFVLPSDLHVILCKHFYHRSVHTTTSCVFIFSVSWNLPLHWVFFSPAWLHQSNCTGVNLQCICAAKCSVFHVPYVGLSPGISHFAKQHFWRLSETYALRSLQQPKTRAGKEMFKTISCHETEVISL